MPSTSSSTTGSAPQPMAAAPNPSRPQRKLSTAPLRLPSYSARTGASPMSFGAAMSGISFGNGGGGPSGMSYNRAPGSYGARFYSDDSPGMFDSPQMAFGQSINMEGGGSFVSSSHAFGLMGSSYTRRSYAAAAGGREVWSPANLSASLASLTTNPMGSLSHSYSRGQLETLMSKRNEAEYTKEYDCCGNKLQGLHALLEHVEDQHPYSDPNMPDGGFSPVTLAMDLDFDGDLDQPPSITTSTRSSTSPRPMPNYPLTPTSTSAPKTDTTPPGTLAPAAANTNANANQLSLSLSDVLKSPPQDENGLPAFNRQSGSPDSASTATSGNAHPAAPKITSASRGAFLAGGGGKNGQQRFDRAFNEVVAAGGGSTRSNDLLEDPSQPAIPTAVAPSVLFTSSAQMGLPGASQVVGRREGTTGPTPAAGAPPPPPGAQPAAADVKTPVAADDKATTDGATPATGGPPPPPGAAPVGDRTKAPEPQLPQPSLFTTHKAWRCPNPGCNKAYKQSNGLKYHLQKGQCDFAIHDALDHGLTLEEAEERARPYVCAVGAGCTKRYRQMNGLKYHYLNSGEHGQYGLRMLQNGTHPHPPSLPPPPKRDRPPQSNRDRATPYAIPSQMQRPAVVPPSGHQVQGAPAPRMGTWPARPPVANGAPVPPTNGVAVAAPTQLQRPQAPAPTGPAAATTTTAASKTTATAQPQVTKPVQVQRGRDAVLFSSVDLTDV